jgi:NADPH-dependent glutamate synthase beta subunit-like oxidoreductase
MVTRRTFMFSSGALAVAVALPLRGADLAGVAAATDFVTAYCRSASASSASR